MNDDLEERLGSLCPAEPPRELMRRLRAAEPAIARPETFWPWLARLFGARQRHGTLAFGTALLVALTLALTLWSKVRPSSTFVASEQSTLTARNALKASATAAKRQNAQALAERPSDLIFEAGSFEQPEVRYAVLDRRLSAKLNDFRLETPSGPMRLNCGYPLLESPSNGSLFGKLSFDLSD